MRKVPKLIRRPSRSGSSVVLALLLLAGGSLGAWLTGQRLITGYWPRRALHALEAIKSTSLSSTAALIAAGVVAACGLIMIIAALWPGRPERVEILPDDIPGQTAVRRRDLAKLVRLQVEQLGGANSVSATARRSRVNVVVHSVLDELEPVQQAAQKQTDQALQMLAPVGIKGSRLRVKHAS